MQKKTIAGLSAVAVLSVGVAGSSAAEPEGASAVSRFQDRLARELGVSQRALDAAAQRAARGTVSQLRKEGRIDERRAEALERRIQRGRDAPFARLGKAGPSGLRRAGLDAAAGAIGIERPQLQAELRGGRSPADIIAAHRGDRGDVGQAVERAVRERLERRVERGMISSQQADGRARKLAERLTGERPLAFGAHRKGR